MGTWLVKMAGSSENQNAGPADADRCRTGRVYEFNRRRCYLYSRGTQRLDAYANVAVAPDDAAQFRRAYRRHDDAGGHPPNLVVNSELLREGYAGFSFFSVTPISLVVLVLGIIYMLLMRFMLKGDNPQQQRDSWKRRTFRDLIKEYRLTGARVDWRFVRGHR